MTHGTIEETYEYRVTTILEALIKMYSYKPKDPTSLFDWLENPHIAEALGNQLITDAMSWGGDEQFWFDKITEKAGPA